MSTAIEPLQAAGFLLAGYAVMGNDALQTLGPYLAGNRGRSPKPLQALFLCSVLCGVLLLGWSRGAGDPAWGRLNAFTLPERFGWIDLLPPLTVLALTRWGAPVSTSFLVLTSFTPANLPRLLRQSLGGYGVALALGFLLYAAVAWLLERQVLAERLAGDSPVSAAGTADPAHPARHPLWLALQWIATGWLWGQWLVQDLANMYIYLPRRLNGGQMALSLLVLCAGVCLLVRLDGGAIQRVLTGKSNGEDPRSTTVISALYGAILFGFARFTSVPMSTTWVFLGLLAGRELALYWRMRADLPSDPLRELGSDLLKAGLGLTVSVGVALAVQPLRGLPDSIPPGSLPPGSGSGPILHQGLDPADPLPGELPDLQAEAVRIAPRLPFLSDPVAQVLQQRIEIGPSLVGIPQLPLESGALDEVPASVPGHRWGSQRPSPCRTEEPGRAGMGDWRASRADGP